LLSVGVASISINYPFWVSLAGSNFVLGIHLHHRTQHIQSYRWPPRATGAETGKINFDTSISFIWQCQILGPLPILLRN
jgi:hypothetical protein